jgi:hypothetical protein
MPYISQKDRLFLDEYIDQFLYNINTIYKDTTFYNKGGLANYIITRILTNFLKCGNKWSYTKLSQIVGTLECAKMEIYRKLISPYEDQKISENGDLEEFSKEKENDKSL